jgi:hypothetical protein
MRKKQEIELFVICCVAIPGFCSAFAVLFLHLLFHHFFSFLPSVNRLATKQSPGYDVASYSRHCEEPVYFPFLMNSNGDKAISLNRHCEELE